MRLWCEDYGHIRPLHWFHRHQRHRHRGHEPAQGRPPRPVRGQDALQLPQRPGRHRPLTARNRHQLGHLQAPGRLLRPVWQRYQHNLVKWWYAGQSIVGGGLQVMTESPVEDTASE